MHRLTRNEALLTLEKRGPILETALEVSQLMRAAGLDGGVIGGVAVVLHGHVRTTVDVDVFCTDTKALADLLAANGFSFDAENKQFLKSTVPVHLVTGTQTKSEPRTYEEIDGIRTISLADLINMKLRSGTEHITRAQDLADVIALIRHHRLTGEFTARIDQSLRSDFRKLVKAVEKESMNE